MLTCYFFILSKVLPEFRCLKRFLYSDPSEDYFDRMESGRLLLARVSHLHIEQKALPLLPQKSRLKTCEGYLEIIANKEFCLKRFCPEVLSCKALYKNLIN